ncbi:hypothetical protein JDM601_3988 [Mycolicibacter sinensis]|uniref:Uncharacterized protein n=1 Tax=Mycolicibacter sinensis (strain JDM601) TaxID=875328 RepID=F5YSZ9_MYCSD|nr:hypothetical protein JDM601_3988 [Mycolicibacter sinensis]
MVLGHRSISSFAQRVLAKGARECAVSCVTRHARRRKPHPRRVSWELPVRRCRGCGRRPRRRTDRTAGRITRAGGTEPRPARFVAGAGGPEAGAHRRAVVHHAMPVLVSVPTTVAEVAAGAEDHRGDEYGPGDDHHPRCGLIQPVRFGRRCCRWRRWRRLRCRCFGHIAQSCLTTTPAAALREGRRLVVRARGLPARRGRRGAGDRRRNLAGSRAFRSRRRPHPAGAVVGTLAGTVVEALVKPLVEPLVEHRAVMRAVVAVVPARAALAGPHSGEEDRRDDEDDAGDDGHPGGEPIDPVRLRLGGAGRCGRRSRGFGCFAHG